MNFDLEKLREELKLKIDEVIDKYTLNANSIIEIPDENIYMEFKLNGQDYMAFSDDNDSEEMNMMFAKVDYLDDSKILRNIEDKNELQDVINEFNRRLVFMAD